MPAGSAEPTRNTACWEMLLAELTVRHTRRHMPTRRVALGDRLLPTAHPGYGPLLLACVAATAVKGLDEEQTEALGTLPPGGPHGAVGAPPGAALPPPGRHRGPGLVPAPTPRRGYGSRGRARRPRAAPRPPAPRGGDGGGRPWPPTRASSACGPSRRRSNARVSSPRASPPASSRTCSSRSSTSSPARRPLRHRARGGPPTSGGVCRPSCVGRWRCSGSRPARAPEKDEVLRRFRRLIRLAHPDHGAAHGGAAERIVELGEARKVLLHER